MTSSYTWDDSGITEQHALMRLVRLVFVGIAICRVHMVWVDLEIQVRLGHWVSLGSTLPRDLMNHIYTFFFLFSL